MRFNKYHAAVLFGTFFLFSPGVGAQNSTSSPYSGFGIGQLEMSSGGRNSGMGYTGIALRSGLFLNTANPASLTTIDPQTFIFDMGMNFTYTQLENSIKSVDVNNGNLSWLQMGFPISKKLFGGLSLNPKSSVGYNIYTERTIQGTLTEFPAIYQGEGGLSEVAGLLAFKASESFSVGAKAGYLWGNVAEILSQQVTLSDIAYTIKQTDNSHYTGFYFNAGSQLVFPVSTKASVVWGVVAGLSSRLNSTRSTSVTKSYGSSTDVLSDDSKTYYSRKLPLDFGTGFSLHYGYKWVGTAEYRRCDWTEAKIGINPKNLDVNNIVRAGLEFAPGNDPKKIRQAARYRLGYRYESGYIKIFNEQIHEQGITMGFGLPIRKDKSYANFSLDLGSRGTIKSNLVQEKYVRLIVGFNLRDQWFTKRMYD